jgi:general secretion pathway protein L
MSLACIFLPPAACAEPDPQLPVLRVMDGALQRLPFADALLDLEGAWRLIVPVEAVSALAVQLPTQKARWLRQALPFAVEELLAEDVELMHLALGELLEDGRHRVFALRLSWLGEWLGLCGEHRPAVIEVDADLLPRQGTQLLWLESRWLLGGEGVARLALQEDDWPLLASLSETPPVVRCAQQTSGPLSEGAQRVAEPALWLAQQPAGCNLAQGEFAVRQAGAGWQRWQPVLGAVGLCVLLQWGFYLAQGWHLQREGQNYRDANAQLYRELFPADSRLINMRAQFDQHLAAGGAGQGRLLGVLGRAADALLEDPQVRVQQLEFSDSRGDLALQLVAPGFDALERLRERLIEAGLAVELGSASRDAGNVSARLVIGAGA